MNLIDRWAQIAENKFNDGAGVVTTGTLAASNWTDEITLGDVSTFIGMLYIISLLIPRIYHGYQWLKKRLKK